MTKTTRKEEDEIDFDKRFMHRFEKSPVLIGDVALCGAIKKRPGRGQDAPKCPICLALEKSLIQ